MDKPKPESRRTFDYQECSSYIQDKYEKYNEDDFWGWLSVHKEFSNGSDIYLSKDDWSLKKASPEIKEMYQLYLDEFADKNGELTLHIWW